MNENEVRQLHAESIIIDGLNASYFLDERIISRMHAGGVTAVNATIAAWHAPLETMDMIAALYAFLEQHREQAMQVRSAADIDTAKATNRVGMIFGFQDTNPIADNLRLLSIYHALGARIIQLTYNFRNLVGSGCQVADDEGLTSFGREVVAEMNRLGMLVDLSHCGPRTTLEAIEASRMPVAITHANARARCNHPRNKSDDALKLLAERGGVVGAVVFPLMLTGQFQATLDDYVAMIDYLVNLVGIDHVGLGPDFMEEMPREIALQVLQGLPPETQELFLNAPSTRGFESISACFNVTQALLARGYSAEDTRKILGGNWLRLYRMVWGA